MSKVNAGQAPSTLIPEYIGSDFDAVLLCADNITDLKGIADNFVNVVVVADNIDNVNTVALHIDDVDMVANNIEYVKDVSEGIAGLPVISYIGATPPLQPAAGSEWYCTTDGRTYVYYIDADSTQWVESSPQSTIGVSDTFTLWKRSLAEIGLTLVGTFQEGCTVTAADQAVLDFNASQAYQWKGTIPPAGKVIPVDSTPATAGDVYPTAWVDRTDVVLRNQLSSPTGSSIVGWILAKTGAVYSTVARWFAGRPVSLMDFLTDAQRDDVLSYTGSLDCTNALLAAISSSKRVELPAGRIKFSNTLTLGAMRRLSGQGIEKTVLDYHGTSDAILMGTHVSEDIQKYIEISGFRLNIKTPGYSADALALENCVRFKVSDVWLVGPGTPNSQGVLTGNGLHIRNGSFIGSVSGVYAELFNCGARESNSDTNANLWTAAIVYDQQCEFTNNNFGMIFGTETSSLLSSQGSNLRDVTVEFNYQGGLLINNGFGVDIGGAYFEANGNYDVQVGNVSATGLPVCVSVHNCNLPSGNIPSPYGPTPYQAKIKVVKGVNTNIYANNISNPDGGLCVDVGAVAQDTGVFRNRLNTTSPTPISDTGSNSLIYQNKGYNPEAPVGLSLLNSWVDVGGQYQSVRYYLSQDLHGRKFVILDGAVSGGAEGTVAAVLPVGRRPTGRQDFVVGQTYAGSSNAITVLSDGSIIVSIKSTVTVCLCGVVIPLG